MHNGVITLPGNQQSWNGKKIKVILLDEADADIPEISANESVAEADFFNCAGIWKNRDDITQESIRTKAWRDNK
ncbi:MAG: hypothetical protein HOP02_00360 [Methylococcaceae bacterium]|nr:hypothetical protein [Methylococcaceae bacterium]